MHRKACGRSRAWRRMVGIRPPVATLRRIAPADTGRGARDGRSAAISRRARGNLGGGRVCDAGGRVRAAGRPRARRPPARHHRTVDRNRAALAVAVVRPGAPQVARARRDRRTTHGRQRPPGTRVRRQACGRSREGGGGAWSVSGHRPPRRGWAAGREGPRGGSWSVSGHRLPRRGGSRRPNERGTRDDRWAVSISLSDAGDSGGRVARAGACAHPPARRPPARWISAR
jgi:hypothetical protein